MSRQNGPGTWAYVPLTDQFTSAGWSQDRIPKEYVWEKEEQKRGGVLPLDRLHSTVLLRLNTADTMQVFREAVDRSDPIKDMKILHINPPSRVSRLSQEFGEEVYSISASISSPSLTSFRKFFLEQLWEHMLSKNEVANTPEAKKELFLFHDPYHYTRNTDAHCSLAYVKGAHISEVSELCKALQREFAEAGVLDRTPTIRSLEVKYQEREGKAEVFWLGRHVPSSARAISFQKLKTLVNEYKAQQPEKESISISQRFMQSIKSIKLKRASRSSSKNGTGFTINKDTTTAEVVANVVVPRTETTVQNFASHLAQTTDSDVIGEVDFFVSHAWQYKFLDVFDVIEQHYERAGKLLLENEPERKHVYYWLDVFAVNQHNINGAGEIDSLWKVVEMARETLIVLQPWDSPVALTRIWCLYELLATIEAQKKSGSSSTRLSVGIPSSELKSFHQTLSSDFAKIRNTITNIDSAKAEATNPLDLQQIRAQIERTVGYSLLNTVVKDQLRLWLVEAGLAQLQSLSGSTSVEQVDFASIPVSEDFAQWENTVQFAHQLALVLGDLGKYGTAQQLYEKVLLEREKVLGKSHMSTISCAGDLGFLLTKRHEPQRAEELLSIYIQELENIIALKVGDAGQTNVELRRIIDVEAAGQKNVEVRRSIGAREIARRARLANRDESASVLLSPVVQKKGMINTTTTTSVEALQSLLLTLKNTRAMARGAQPGKLEQAMSEYKEVLQGRTKEHSGEENSDAIATTNNMAWLLAKNGNNLEAKPLFEKVLHFRSKRYGVKYPATLNAKQNLAITLQKLHEQSPEDTSLLQRARVMLEEVCTAKIENMGLENRSTLSAVLNLLECLQKIEDTTEELNHWTKRVSSVDKRLLDSYGISPRLQKFLAKDESLS